VIAAPARFFDPPSEEGSNPPAGRHDKQKAAKLAGLGRREESEF
jgi:hypothetical protein